MRNIGKVPIMAPPKTCGINIIGFKIMGAPNKIGSLIPMRNVINLLPAEVLYDRK